MLRFQDDAASILGIEMGAAHVEVVLTDLRGRVLHAAQAPHPVREDPEGTRALILELCEACLHDGDGPAAPLIGIGVALPSPVDPSQPDRLSTVVLPRWEGRLGLSDLEVRFGVPLMLDNDANLGALAESWWGAGPRRRRLHVRQDRDRRRRRTRHRRSALPGRHRRGRRDRPPGH